METRSLGTAPRAESCRKQRDGCGGMGNRHEWSHERQAMTSKTNEKPKQSIVWYRGTAYVLDLVLCRRALVRRQVEGELHNMTSLAVAASVSRSTASRFFSGRSTSLAATLRILKALHLEFGDVATPAGEEELA